VTTLTDDLLARARRLDTASVADAMDGLNLRAVLRGIRARVPGASAVGPAWTVTYRPVDVGLGSGQFRGAADYLDDVPRGAVVLIDNHGADWCTNWGSLLTLTARGRGVEGTVIHGSARDLAEIRTQGYPLFTTAVTMTSGKNRVELAAVGQPVDVHGTVTHPGDLIFADDNGVLRVPARNAAEVVALAEQVEATERAIADAVLGGMPLAESRRQFGYARPWQVSHGHAT
jgi:regulator of RNase E activity RraA